MSLARTTERPGRRARRRGQGLLRRARPEGDPRAQGAAEDRGAVRQVQPHDADHHRAAAAGDRARAGRRRRRRLPARRQCDLAVASDAAKFTTPGVTWGFFCSTPGVARRPQPVAQARHGDAAHRRPDRRAEGARVGAGQPRRRRGRAGRGDARSWRRQIAEKPPATVAAGKRAFYEQMELGMAQALRARLVRHLGQLRARGGASRAWTRSSSKRPSLIWKQPRQRTLADDIILETRGLTKEFKGFVAVKRRRTCSVRRGTHPRADRPERRRQDDLLQPAHASS